MRKLGFLWGALVILACVSSGGWYAISQAKGYQNQTVDINQPIKIKVKSGVSLIELLNEWHHQGYIAKPSWRLRLLVKLQPEWAAIKAGIYQLIPRESLQQILQRLVRGEQYQYSITFVEGSTFREWRHKLAQAEGVVDDIATLSDQQITERLIIKQASPEGWLFPETYHYTAGTLATRLLEVAHQRMVRELDNIWQQRQAALPLQSPYEALILASIIEKETGLASERPEIAAVFINRLKKRMRLQTDPTVIYGIGADFDGNLTRKLLHHPTDYNTYVIRGLPPTPIAMPGAAAIIAAVKPAHSPYLYFVSKGDGSHKFSQTLAEHNRAVRKYQLKRP